MISLENSITMLEKNERLSYSQMAILDILGHHPDLTDKEIAKLVGFKYYNYISTVKNTILKKRGYLSGANYWIDLSKISTNPVNRLIFFIMFPKKYTYDYIISLLQTIDSWSFFYPLEEGVFNEMLVSVYNTESKAIIRIMDYLKDEGVLFYYTAFELEGLLDIYNPYHLTKNTNNICETPLVVDKINFDRTFEPVFEATKEKRLRLSLLDTRLIMYLQSGYYNGDLSRLMKHDAQIVDKEGNNPYLFGYNAWRYSYEKLKNAGIVRKFYTVYPMPKDKCSNFFLMLAGKSYDDTKKIAASVGACARTLKAGAFVKSLNENDYGKYHWCVHIRCHPLYKERIMGLLNTPFIDSKIRYNVWSISYHESNKSRAPRMRYYFEQSISLEEPYFDFKSQTLHYEYKKYLKKVKEIVNNELPLSK